MKSVLISTLGDPATWDPVEYVYEDFSFKSSFTLPFLNYIAPKPDTIVIIVLDTIIDEEVSSYDDLIRKVYSKYVDLIKERAGLSCDRVKIVVAPGVGRFRPKDKDLFFNFTGSLSDFYAYVIFEISRIFMESEKEITIHLDLTHGINFMPSLTLLALRKITSILALVHNVRLKIYNAEPYRRNVTNRLNIHLVEDGPALIEYDLMPLGARGKCMPLKHYGDIICHKEDLWKLILNCDKIRPELNAFLSSIYNGLPLALYTFYPDIAQLEDIIENLVKIWRENISVTRNRNEIYVKRNLCFSADFTKLVQIWLIAKMLNLQKKTEVSYDELNSIKSNFFSRLSKKNEEMVSRDLHRIKEDVEQAKECCRDWVKLCTIYKETKYFTPRDFLMHSGLEMNVTEVKYDGKSIILRYAKNEIEKVIDGCMSGLQKPT